MNFQSVVSDARTQEFISKLKRRQIFGSRQVAVETSDILRIAINKTKITTLRNLLQYIKAVGKVLIQTQPLAFAIGNIVRKILFIVRTEYQMLKKGDLKNSNSHNFMLGPSSTAEDEMGETIVESKELKDGISAAIAEMMEVLKNVHLLIAEQSIEYIHSNEVIMTFGGSKTVETFLITAGHKRRFEVLVAEGMPACQGQNLSVVLANSGIDTTLIPDSAIFAMMARVNKVVVGTHAVLANGGLIAPCGTHLVALAAKHHSVPFVVCTPMFKMCPLFANDQETFNDIDSPASIMQFEEADSLNGVRVINPRFDYVPAELVSLYVTEEGGHNPSYIYRILARSYDPSDYVLE